MKNEILKFLESKERKWKSKTINYLKNNQLQYETFCEENLKFLKNPSYLQVIWHIANEIYKEILCLNCNNQAKFNNKFFYNKFCSVKCARDYFNKNFTDKQKEEKQNKLKKTNLKKYGVDFVFKSKIVKEKIKKTNLKKYGVENPLKNEEIKLKKINSTKLNNLKRYNVEHNWQISFIKEKIKKTNLKKYGTEIASKSDKIKEKTKQTCLTRYGVTSFTKTKIFLEKYFSHEYGKKFKDYILPSGKIVKIQGYENWCIDELLKTHSEDDLVIGHKNLFSVLKRIKYFYKNKEHNYIPDIYIKSKNLIIEVKSDFTFSLCKERNLLKKKASIDAGYNFLFVIYDKKKNKISYEKLK